MPMVYAQVSTLPAILGLLQGPVLERIRPNLALGLLVIAVILLASHWTLSLIRLRRLRRRQAVLTQVRDAITQGPGLDRVLEKTYGALRILEPKIENCVVHLYDQHLQKLMPRYSSKPTGQQSVGIAPDVGLAGRVWATRELQYTPDAHLSPDYAPLQSSPMRRSLVVAPLAHGSRLFGTLSLTSYAVDAFDEELFDLLSTVAVMISAPCHKESMGRSTEEETRYVDAILARTNDGIVIVDLSGRVLRYNPSAAQILGADSSELLGRQLGDPTTSQPMRTLSTLIGTGLEHAEPSSRRMILDAPAHAVLDVRVSERPRSGLNERIIIIQDMTHLSERIESLSMITSAVADQIADAAGAVRGYATLLGSSLTGEGPDARWAEQLRDRGAHLERLGRGLRHLTAIEEGSLDRIPQSCSLGDILEDVLLDLQPLGEARQLNLDIDYPRNLSQTRAARDLVADIFYNLVYGAMMRGDPGDTIVVRMSATMWEIVFSVAVADRPYSDSEQAALFANRYQPDGSRADHLPTIIARELCQALSGHLWLDENDDSGATIQAIIPIQRA